jgi:peptide/nickel transport system substrate-binding protein
MLRHRIAPAALLAAKLMTPGLMTPGLFTTGLLATGLLATPLQAATFRWANDGDANSMDPYVRNESFLLTFTQNIYDPLVRRDRTLKVEPALAESWEQPDATTWRFHLRHGVKFQGGEPFTADDVLFSYQRVIGPNSQLNSNMATVQEVKKVDDFTVDFITKVPDPILVQNFTTWGIMSKGWCEAHNATQPANLSNLKEENYATRNANGTGPFILETREPDRRTTLKNNPDWWDKAPGNVTDVQFNVISNASTRVAALLSGDVDMIYSVPPQDIDRLQHTEGIKVLVGPELRTIFLSFDTLRPELLKSDVKGKNPFQDVRVRRAFYEAIDAKAIQSRVMRGQSRPTGLMYGPGINGFTEASDTRLPYDPAAAKKLLAEAGYPEGFGVTMDCPNDRYVNDEAICQAVTAMLARVGVKVTLNAQTRLKYFSEINNPNYHPSFYLLGWTPNTYDAHNAFFNLLGTRNGVRGVINDGGWSNPDFDALLDKMAVETNPEKRQAMIEQASAMVRDQVPAIPLHQQTVVWATRSNIELQQLADNTFPLRFVTVK